MQQLNVTIEATNDAYNHISFCEKANGLFVGVCGFYYKNQSSLELKIVIPIENGEEPKYLTDDH